MAASYSQMPHGMDPNIAPLPREEIAHRLVRLDTEIRQQLDDEGWEGSHPDGFLTEEELLNAARTQGVLKRRLRNWRNTALAALAWLLLSCGVILSMVIVGNQMIKETQVREETGFLYSKGTRHIVQTAQAAHTFDLLGWATQNPVNILNLDRVILQVADGVMMSMSVAAADADFGTTTLTIQTASGGYLVVSNETVVALNLEVSQIPDQALNASLTGTKLLTTGFNVADVNGQDAVVHNPGNSVPSLVQTGYCVCGQSQFCGSC